MLEPMGPNIKTEMVTHGAWGSVRPYEGHFHLCSKVKETKPVLGDLITHVLPPQGSFGPSWGILL